jgi:hypothetical protein
MSLLAKAENPASRGLSVQSLFGSITVVSD